MWWRTNAWSIINWWPQWWDCSQAGLVSIEICPKKTKLSMVGQHYELSLSELTLSLSIESAPKIVNKSWKLWSEINLWRTGWFLNVLDIVWSIWTFAIVKPACYLNVCQDTMFNSINLWSLGRCNSSIYTLPNHLKMSWFAGTGWGANRMIQSLLPNTKQPWVSNQCWLANKSSYERIGLMISMWMILNHLNDRKPWLDNEIRNVDPCKIFAPIPLVR